MSCAWILCYGARAVGRRPAEETPRASYELDPALIQLVGVLCLIGGCLGLVVYAILSIDE